MLSLSRAIYQEDEKKSREEVARQVVGKRVVLRAGKYRTELSIGEIGAVLNFSPDEQGNDTIDLSLGQIALSVLISCGMTITEDEIAINRPGRLSKEDFDSLVHLCLFRVPKIESSLRKQFDDLSETVRNN